MIPQKENTMNIVECISRKCITISETTNYWLFRTDSGSLFTPFMEDNVISIGYRKITTEYIKKLFSSKAGNKEKIINDLTMKVKEYYERCLKPGLIATQLYNFAFELRKGDYILIPSANTDKISIGIIENNDIYEGKIFKISNNEKVEIREFNKLKKVNWLKTINKADINPNLYLLFSMHQTIGHANRYAKWIDAELYSFFKKGEEYHLVVDISKYKIPAFTLFKFYADLLTIANQYNEQHYSFFETIDDETIDDINVTINLNSPGKIELFGKGVRNIIVAGVIIIALNGGGFKFKTELLGVDIEISTPGFIKKINEFLDSNINRKMKEQLTEQMKQLEIKDPTDIIPLLSEINKANQDE
jgi:hypothetical protein